MSWTITKQKPLAGVSKDKKGRLIIELSDAFDAPPTFEQVARHVGLSPETLLNDLLEEEGDEPLMAARHLLMLVIYQAIDPENFSWESHKNLDSPERMRSIIGTMADNGRREDIYAHDQIKPNRQTKRFPLWLMSTTIKGRPVVVPAPLAASTAKLIDLRRFHWDEIHDYLEANHQDFVELREECERLYLASQTYIAETRRIKTEAGAVLQPMNDLAVMITNMLAYTDPPLDNHAHADAIKKNRRVAAEVAADLQLGLSLVAEHFFATEDHPIAKARAQKFRIIKHSLEHFPGEAASRLVMLDDLAPPEVMFEYLRAMEACAAALSMADPEDAGPLFEKHFMHLLVSVVESVGPIDVSGLDGVKKTLAEAANDFDVAALKKLDKKGDYPAIPVALPSANPLKEGERILSWIGKPASIIGKISNYALVAVEGSTFAKGSGAAMLTRLALGVAGSELAERKAALLAMLKQAAGEHVGKDDALELVLKKEAREKIKAASKSAGERVKISNEGVLAGISTMKFFLDLSGMLTAFHEIRRENEKAGESWDSEDWLKAASAVHSATGSAASLVEAIDSLSARSYVGAGHAIALESQGIGNLAKWAKIADAQVLPVIEVALGLWSARENQLKALRWGHESDAGFEVFCLVVGLIRYVHPLAGFVATAVLGVIKALKEIDGGSNGMHKYYEYQRGQIVAQLMAIRGMKKVAKRWEERFLAGSPNADAEEIYKTWHNALDIRNVKDTSLTRMDRLYALVRQLNEWQGAMKPVSMPPFADLRWDKDEATVRRSLERQGFQQRELDLVLKA